MVSNSKEYNKNYYENTKHEKGLKRVVCDCCSKLIISNALKRHKESAKCKLITLNKLIENKNIIYDI